MSSVCTSPKYPTTCIWLTFWCDEQNYCACAFALQRYLNTLKQAEEELDALLPANKQHKGNLGEGRRSAEDGDESDEEGDQDDAAAEGDAEAAWEEGAVKVGSVGVERIAGLAVEGTACPGLAEL